MAGLLFVAALDISERLRRHLLAACVQFFMAQRDASGEHGNEGVCVRKQRGAIAKPHQASRGTIAAQARPAAQSEADQRNGIGRPVVAPTFAGQREAQGFVIAGFPDAKLIRKHGR
ncbi:hypothetical protein [Paraburkholderia hospita]|uniref:hypothetical protein n=1 Tax=Paraburkholderia hospita TaxID=169430 RepID=UPI001EE6773D|nr:hypothetical protein [Paraburkholderia hospita]